jgi:RNA polymerase sigma-70 factor (ECF subfamily)
MPIAETDESAFLRELRGGSRAAFEKLLDRYERRVYNLVLRMLGDPSDAEDAAQEVFVHVYRSLKGFQGKSRLDTWIHRIAVNVCLQRRRKRKLPTVELMEEDLLSTPEDDPFRSAAREELSRQVAGALEELTEAQRDVVLLHGMQGLSYAEVAEVLSCPVGTVKSRLNAAFKRLRQVLGSYVAADRMPLDCAASRESSP